MTLECEGTSTYLHIERSVKVFELFSGPDQFRRHLRRSRWRRESLIFTTRTKLFILFFIKDELPNCRAPKVTFGLWLTLKFSPKRLRSPSCFSIEIGVSRLGGGYQLHTHIIT